MAKGDGRSPQDHIVAIFADRTSAEAAVDHLIADGFGSDHLGIAVRSDESVAFEHDEEADLARDVVTGVAAAAPAGAIAGIALFAVATGGIGLGGILAVGGAGAIWGVILGGAAGVAHGEPAREQHEQLLAEHLDPGQVMVVVDSHDRVHAVTQTLLDHGATIRPVVA